MRLIFSIVLFNTDRLEVIRTINEISKIEDSVIYIFDNSDKPAEYLNKKSGINYTYNGTNLGFGGAHNLILNFINITENDLIFIINTDVYFNYIDIEKIKFKFQNDSTIVAANPLIRTNQKYSIIQRLPKAYEVFLQKFHFNERTREAVKSQYSWYIPGKLDQIHTELLSGCFLIVRSNAFKFLGGFSKDFFLYFEDWELSQRLKKLGKLVTIQSFEIEHVRRGEANFKLKPFIYFTRSFIKFFFNV